MSRREIECVTCGAPARSMIEAANCCDPISNDLDDPHPELVDHGGWEDH